MRIWTIEVKNGLKRPSWGKLAETLGYALIAFLIYLAASSAGRFASGLDPSRAPGVELTFASLFTGFGLLMLLMHSSEGAIAHLYESSDLLFLLASPLPEPAIYAYKLLRVATVALRRGIFWLLPPWIAMTTISGPTPSFLIALPFGLIGLALIASLTACLYMTALALLARGRIMRAAVKIIYSLLILALAFGIVSFSSVSGEERLRAFERIYLYLGPMSSDWIPHVWACRALMAHLGVEGMGSAWRWWGFIWGMALSLIHI